MSASAPTIGASPLNKTVGAYQYEVLIEPAVINYPFIGAYQPNKIIGAFQPPPPANIYYTTDGSTPDENSTLYTEPFELTSAKTVKAISIKAGELPSAVTTEVYTISQVEAPIVTPEAGPHVPTHIVITCATDGATIYYTTDGSTPTSGSTEYTEPFEITTVQTIKAIAIKTSFDDSEVTTVAYTMSANAYMIVIKDLQGGTSYPTVSIAEMELRATPGGADLLDTEDYDLQTDDNAGPSFTPDKAVDNNTGTMWSAPSTPTLLANDDVWVSVSFDSYNGPVFEYSITSRVSSLDSTPTEWDLYKWDGAEWVFVLNQTTPADWEATETRVFQTIYGNGDQQPLVFIIT